MFHSLFLSLGHENLVELLLEYGADINGRNRKGQRPQDIALSRGILKHFCLNLITI